MLQNFLNLFCVSASLLSKAAGVEGCFSDILTMSTSEVSGVYTDTASTLLADDPNEIYDFW